MRATLSAHVILLALTTSVIPGEQQHLIMQLCPSHLHYCHQNSPSNLLPKHFVPQYETKPNTKQSYNRVSCLTVFLLQEARQFRTACLQEFSEFNLFAVLKCNKIFMCYSRSQIAYFNLETFPVYS